MRFFHFLKETFSFDERSLALYRILMGLIVMSDVLYRWVDLKSFYTDQGIIPRNLFLNEMTLPWSFSLHLSNGSEAIISILFFIHLICGLFILFGYKTQLSMLFAFIFTVSVHNRNWLVNNGGDDVLRAILFISIFLPLGRCFSIDQINRPKNVNDRSHFSVWNLVFFVQVFAIYFISYILKDHPIWRSEWSAFFYSSRLDIFATPLGIWLRNYPTFGVVITFFSIYLEWLGPLLLVFSFLFFKHWWKIRTLLVFAFIGFHFGIFLTMNIGLFTFICEAMWVIFLPGKFWEILAPQLKKMDSSKLTKMFQSIFQVHAERASLGRVSRFWIWPKEAFGIFMLMNLIVWNCTTVKKWNIQAPFFQNVTRWLHLYQEWNMFAPYPKMDNIWIEIPAELSDGQQIELLSGDKDIYSVKDQSFVKGVKNEHWRKFYLNLSDRTDYSRYYGGYLCRRWNDQKIRSVENALLKKFEIIVYSQATERDGSKGGISRKLSWKHWCFDQDYKRENPPKGN
jgi:Vitamin K-dependent gamma-carboxylase